MSLSRCLLFESKFLAPEAVKLILKLFINRDPYGNSERCFHTKKKNLHHTLFKSLVNVCLHRNKNICLRSFNPNQFFLYMSLPSLFPSLKQNKTKNPMSIKKTEIENTLKADCMKATKSGFQSSCFEIMRQLWRRVPFDQRSKSGLEYLVFIQLCLLVQCFY